MGAILALTEILYLPADGRGEGLVAEEILDWVNTVDKGESLPPPHGERARLADRCV